MATGKFTLDDAALELVQLEAEDVAGAKRLRDRLRRLARDRSLAETVRAEAAAAADAITAGLKRELAAGLVEAGRRIEEAMCAADDALEATERERPAEAMSSSEGQLPIAVDPLMLAALAEFEAEHATNGVNAGDVVPDATGAIQRPAAAAPAVSDEPVAQAMLSWSQDADPELLEGFVGESAEYLQSAESALLELEADPLNIEAVNTVFRCFHTIKGTSAFLGLDRISELAHRAESLMSRVRDREIRLEGGYAELALQSVDALAELVCAAAAALAGRAAIEPDGHGALCAALADPEAALARMALEPAAGAARVDRSTRRAA
ncbi:MAG: Hpt domain-containing protein, partial [Longimicrobiales bacterium]